MISSRRFAASKIHQNGIEIRNSIANATGFRDQSDVPLRAATAPGGERWCIFDNTTLGAATGNALALVRLLEE